MYYSRIFKIILLLKQSLFGYYSLLFQIIANTIFITTIKWIIIGLSIIEFMCFNIRRYVFLYIAASFILTLTLNIQNI